MILHKPHTKHVGLIINRVNSILKNNEAGIQRFTGK